MKPNRKTMLKRIPQSKVKEQGSYERTTIEESKKGMKNMTRVEVELEAELEQLELNSKHQRKIYGLNEIDPNCMAK